MPKILGSRDLVVSKELKQKLEPLAKVKWRSAVIGEPFFLEWGNKNGFELFDEFHEREMRRCVATGKSEYECVDDRTTDPGLAYLSIVKEYGTPNFESAAEYFELIQVPSTYMINNGSYDDVVAMDFDRRPEPVKFVRATSDWNKWFSLSLLQTHGIVRLKSDFTAVSPSVFAVMDESFEREYYDVIEIHESVYPKV
jgi:hypothetical protein